MVKFRRSLQGYASKNDGPALLVYAAIGTVALRRLAGAAVRVDGPTARGKSTAGCRIAPGLFMLSPADRSQAIQIDAALRFYPTGKRVFLFCAFMSGTIGSRARVFRAGAGVPPCREGRRAPQVWGRVLGLHGKATLSDMARTLSNPQLPFTRSARVIVSSS